MTPGASGAIATTSTPETKGRFARATQTLPVRTSHEPTLIPEARGGLRSLGRDRCDDDRARLHRHVAGSSDEERVLRARGGDLPDLPPPAPQDPHSPRLHSTPQLNPDSRL